MKHTALELLADLDILCALRQELAGLRASALAHPLLVKGLQVTGSLTMAQPYISCPGFYRKKI